MNNADLIVATLSSAGIRHGFGVPSGNVLPLMEAMRTGGIDFVLTAHEGTASFAADVMGRMTGVPGLCIATLGPGATNLATGVGSAWLDRSPLLAITCNLNTPQLGRRIQMWIDHEALFKPITKGSFTLEAGSVGETVRKALKLALAEPQGPVHLDLPEDVAVAMCSETVAADDFSYTPVAARASDEAIGAALKALSQARNPVAVLGASAMRMRDQTLLTQLIERFELPFATTTMAKGLVSDAHPLAIGCIERARRQLQRQYLRRADLIVGIGYDTVEVEYEAWIGDVPLLQIDIEPVDTDASVEVRLEVTGDLDDSLGRLLAGATGREDPSARASAASQRQTFQAALRPEVPAFAPHHAIDVVREGMPEDGVLAFDVGAHTHQIASQWTAYAPRQFLITNGWSSMGFGLPAAIAAKLAEPARAVVALIGDGCFQMTCGELATMRRKGLAIPVVVLDDSWLSLIQIKQTRRQYNHYGTQLLPGEYTEPPAHYFGVPVTGVDSADTLRDALRAALTAGEARVIQARVDPSHYMDTVFD